MNDEGIKPFFCRQGSKFPLRDKIRRLIPDHKIYVELFAGSGAIFFNKEKAEMNVLNDLDKDTIDGFKLLIKAPIDPKKYEEIPKTVEAHRKWYDNHKNTNANKLMMRYMQTCEGFSNSMVHKSSEIYKPNNFMNRVAKLPIYKEKLRGVKLENMDYADAIKKYDSPDTFFFVDPPYDGTSDRDWGYAQGNEFDFEKLADTLGGVKGKFLLTINDSKRFRNMYKGYNVKGVSVTTNWQSKTIDGHATKRKELFIMNY